MSVSMCFRGWCHFLKYQLVAKKIGKCLLYILLDYVPLLLQVFEDKDDAVKYCDLLQGGGQGCEGIAELEASSVRSQIDMTF